MGRFSPTGLRPRVLDKLDELGLAMPEEIVELFPEPVRVVQRS